MLKLLGETGNRKEIEAVVREADNNGDGTVDFEGRKLNIQAFRCAHTQIVDFFVGKHDFFYLQWKCILITGCHVSCCQLFVAFVWFLNLIRPFNYLNTCFYSHFLLIHISPDLH